MQISGVGKGFINFQFVLAQTRRLDNPTPPPPAHRPRLTASSREGRRGVLLTTELGTHGASTTSTCWTTSSCTSPKGEVPPWDPSHCSRLGRLVDSRVSLAVRYGARGKGLAGRDLQGKRSRAAAPAYPPPCRRLSK